MCLKQKEKTLKEPKIHKKKTTTIHRIYFLDYNAFIIILLATGGNPLKVENFVLKHFFLDFRVSFSFTCVKSFLYWQTKQLVIPIRLHNKFNCNQTFSRAICTEPEYFLWYEFHCMIANLIAYCLRLETKSETWSS